MDRQMHRYTDIHMDVHTDVHMDVQDRRTDKTPCILQDIVPLVRCPALNLRDKKITKQGKGTADPYCPWTTGFLYTYFEICF